MEPRRIIVLQLGGEAGWLKESWPFQLLRTLSFQKIRNPQNMHPDSLTSGLQNMHPNSLTSSLQNMDKWKSVQLRGTLGNDTRLTLHPSCTYTKCDILCLIIFCVVTTLSCSTLILNYLMISVRHKCVTTFPTATLFFLLSLLILFHIFTNTKFVHVTSTYYHSWHLVLEFTFIITY